MLKLSVVLSSILFSSSAFSKTISAHTCGVGFVNLNGSLYDDAKKAAVTKQLKTLGYYPEIVSTFEEVALNELTLDASLDCTPTYFGFASKTQLRLIDNSSEKILARSESPLVVEMFSCKMELEKAIADLPNCSIK